MTADRATPLPPSIEADLRLFLRCNSGAIVPMAAATAWPCGQCGGMPTEKGHDPCIADLPGVVNACCGHGTHSGYVHFENGLVIRGYFDHA